MAKFTDEQKTKAISQFTNALKTQVLDFAETEKWWREATVEEVLQEWGRLQALIRLAKLGVFNSKMSPEISPHLLTGLTAMQAIVARELVRRENEENADLITAFHQVYFNKSGKHPHPFNSFPGLN